MKLAIMQPYIFPYIGYFQLINAVDKFVVYDNIQFTKKGWINRNRILFNGKDEYFTLPLKKDSDYLNVVDRKLSHSFAADRVKILRKIETAYKKAPEFNQVFPLIEKILRTDSVNLFDFIFQSIESVNNFLGITTELIVSSSVNINHSLKSEQKVLAICKAIGAQTYINPAGGSELYSKELFKENNIELQFLKSELTTYNQFKNLFVPGLSIIDVMMFNSKEKVMEYIQEDFSLS